METISISRSKKGLPCYWESGGGMSNTGDADIVTDSQGNPKTAIYIKRSGSLSCGNHALIPIEVGDHIISASQHRGDFEINVLKIKNIKEEEAEVEEINSYSSGEWDIEPEGKIKEAVETAKRKATSYHCREAFYIKS